MNGGEKVLQHKELWEDEAEAQGTMRRPQNLGESVKREIGLSTHF